MTTPLEIEADRLSQMSFPQFAASGTALQIESAIVPTFIYNEMWFASDRTVAEAIKAENPRAVIYGASELQKIAMARPGETSLKVLHEAKKVFGGRILEIKTKE